MRMGQVIKQPGVEEFVDGFAVVWEDHFEKLTDAGLNHWWVNWMICLNEDSIDREE